MIETPDIVRPPQSLIEGLRQISAATAASELARLGIRDPHIRGPVSWNKGKRVVGPALTLQMMPKREDLYGQSEHDNVELQLHRHVLYHTQPGDIVVVDARGDMSSGIFGEMMLTYFKGRGGAGVNVQKLDLPLWIRGVTPNFHTQTNLMPFAVNVPIAMNNVLVMPGDIIIADDDGAVVVPVKLAPELLKKASEHREWEEFARLKLAEGGDLRKYYPLREDARAEYEAWRRSRAQ
jgi:regulator of RNase E activity RraA